MIFSLMPRQSCQIRKFPVFSVWMGFISFLPGNLFQPKPLRLGLSSRHLLTAFLWKYLCRSYPNIMTLLSFRGPFRNNFPQLPTFCSFENVKKESILILISIFGMRVSYFFLSTLIVFRYIESEKKNWNEFYLLKVTLSNFSNLLFILHNIMMGAFQMKE